MSLIKAIIIPVIFVAFFTNAQSLEGQSVLDNVYVRETLPARVPIPYAPLREADVMWKKRVWRIIDLREKINLPLFYPIQGEINGLTSLSNLLFKATTEEVSLRVYSDLPDDFSVEMTPGDVIKRVSKEDSIPMKSQIDPSLDSLNADGTLFYKKIKEEFTPSRVKKFLLKEEWFFDKQRSVLDVRILGICPLYEMEDKEKGDLNLFWVYFPEARKVLANHDVFNRSNPSERRSFDDIFWKRQFSSYIVKEENVYDRTIAEYKKGMDALLEAQKIKDEIIIFEHDLWEF
jgi:gliding motility associated protien GldN